MAAGRGMKWVRRTEEMLKKPEQPRRDRER